MTIIEIQNALVQAVETASSKHFGVVPDTIATETPPRTELGDVAFPVAFELAKRSSNRRAKKRIRVRSPKF
jgi:arginyl-tRNA synthetase